MDNIRVFLSSFFFLLCSLSQFCHSIDTLTKGQSIRDDVATGNLISTGERFELGFFSPVNSSLRYVGVWYHKIEEQTVVWVANRNKPISDKNGSFSIGSDGNLVVLDGNSNEVWSSNASTVESNTPAAKLSDDGNFVLTSSENIGVVDKAYWQSFEHPTDTYLPGMRVRVNPNTGDNHAFTSWKSASDPSPGNYTLGVDPRGAPQIIIWEHRKRRWRSGQWNSVIFTGVPETAGLASFLYGFRLSPRESDGSMYFTYTRRTRLIYLGFGLAGMVLKSSRDGLRVTRAGVLCNDNLKMIASFTTIAGISGSVINWNLPNADVWMDLFRSTWSNGIEEIGQMDVLGGLNCSVREIVALQGKMVAAKVDLNGLSNCSCTAYAEITGIGCMIWSGNLVDVQEFNKDPSTLMLHIRLADSELGGKRAISYAVIIVVVVVGSFVLAISAWLFWRFKGELEALCKDSPISCCKSSNVKITDPSSREFSTDLSGPSEGFIIDGSQVNSADLPMYNFNAVAAATENFSEENKLGQGGFGPVYKGKLPGGQEIAVKRLSRKSGQGGREDAAVRVHAEQESGFLSFRS
ncbi:hypothetical protein LWI28_025278 [Acer negundo]|uniref:Bulb-type lectin domain-containing protein n=1 Tax=Acer negundo TaxID=4023 RepID=A0AAD5JH64_ACENE|nr:hypothetical protein LWI28_025278 [Acer negundo]